MGEVPCRTLLAPLAAPCFVHRLIGWKQKGFLDFFTRGGRGSFPLYGGTFVRSYLVSKVWVDDRGTGQWK